MILRSWLSGYTRRIFEAGVKAGRAIEADDRWFADHQRNAQAIQEAHALENTAFEALWYAISCRVDEAEQAGRPNA